MSGEPVLAVDLGGTNLQVALVAPRGDVIDRTHAATPIGDPAAVATLIADAAASLEARAGTSGLPLGIAAAGAIDHARGVVLEAPNLQWRDAPLVELLLARRPAGSKIALANDVDAAAWGEYRAIETDPGDALLAIWVGTGIGAGLVLDGRPFRPGRRSAVELGRTIEDPNGPPGARVLEELAGRAGLQRRVHEAVRTGAIDATGPLALACGANDDERATPTTADFADAWKAGDPDARRLLGDAADRIGTAIANLVTVLGVPRVVVGGGMTESLGDHWIDVVRERFRDHVFPSARGDTPIEVTRLRDRAGLLGAAALARDGLGSRPVID